MAASGRSEAAAGPAAFGRIPFHCARILTDIRGATLAVSAVKAAAAVDPALGVAERFSELSKVFQTLTFL
jgi:hypothetical protein